MSFTKPSNRNLLRRTHCGWSTRERRRDVWWGLLDFFGGSGRGVGATVLDRGHNLKKVGLADAVTFEGESTWLTREEVSARRTVLGGKLDTGY